MCYDFPVILKPLARIPPRTFRSSYSTSGDVATQYDLCLHLAFTAFCFSTCPDRSASVCVSDSTSGSDGWPPLYGGGGGKVGKFDPDAIQILHCIYCKDCRMEKLAAEQQARAAQQQQQQQQQGQQGGAMAPGNQADTGLQQGDSGDTAPPTSPQISLDQGSIQHTMDKNKESKSLTSADCSHWQLAK